MIILKNIYYQYDSKVVLNDIHLSIKQKERIVILEILGEAVIAMEFSGSSEDLGRSFHSHPNLLEVIKEAALDVNKEAIHK